MTEQEATELQRIAAAHDTRWAKVCVVQPRSRATGEPCHALLCRSDSGSSKLFTEAFDYAFDGFHVLGDAFKCAVLTWRLQQLAAEETQ